MSNFAAFLRAAIFAAALSTGFRLADWPPSMFGRAFLVGFATYFACRLHDAMLAARDHEQEGGRR